MALISKIQCTRVSYMAHLFFILAIPAILNASGMTKDSAGVEIPPVLLKAYSALIDLNVQKAGDQLNEFREAGGHHPFEWYIASLNTTAKLLTTGEKEDYLSQRELEDNYLNLARRLEDNDPYKLFLVSEIKMQWAFVKLKFGDEISAMWNLRQVYFVSKRALIKYPDFLPLYKTHGFLQALFSGVPKKYQWIIKLLGINPDMEEALRLLKHSDTEDNPVHPESLILTALINAYYYNDFKDALSVCDLLFEDHPESALIRLVYASILVKDSNDAYAIKVLSGLQANQPGYLPIPQRHYLLGEIYLHRGNYRASIDEYDRFLNMQKGEDLIKDAHYKIAMCYWLSDNETMAKKEMETAAASGETKTEIDNYANYMIRSNSLPDKQLLKARYYTDGGYFQKADSVLIHIDPVHLDHYADRVEYNYRKARLFHKTGNISGAIEYYKKTIELQGNGNWYFAPNSCLQLGYIYMEKNPGNACFYLRKVLNYKFDNYQHSIDEKAKLALKKVQKFCSALPHSGTSLFIGRECP